MKRGFTLIELPVSPNNPTGIPITSIFFENSAVGVQHIIDGTSLTVCVSETVISDGIPVIWDGKSPTNGFVLALGGVMRRKRALRQELDQSRDLECRRQPEWPGARLE